MFERYKALITRGALVTAALLAVSLTAPTAEARDTEDCMLAWHRAVSSYLTQNRKQFPQDEKMSLFQPACDLESSGDKKSARIEAIMIGVQNLAKLDPRGCARFMEYYVGSTSPAEVCNAAGGGEEKLRELIESSSPAKW